ncbi:sterol-binding protein [Wenjunlia vitaminophila]|uniref:Sterol-binding protein n=1 Tax=Wenjunlia vitaminophila TaxID=76728 RepID=A0A0T6LUG0_WENVI|nr:hypothetical protein [Wenjunlia vitaminophila]KRV49668.1 sterol-binding protein [Wenjunlia vitaminophila]
MATLDECRAALDQLAENLSRAQGDVHRAAALDRSLSCLITDLDVVFVGRLSQGRLQGVALAETPEQGAEIRLALSGDDLVALVAGDLPFAQAWASGRVQLQAGFRDLLRLRSLL